MRLLTRNALREVYDMDIPIQEMMVVEFVYILIHKKKGKLNNEKQEIFS